MRNIPRPNVATWYVGILLYTHVVRVCHSERSEESLGDNMESAIPEIFRLALKNDKEKNAQDYNEKVLKMNNEKIQNFRISFFDSPLGFQTDPDLGRF